MTHRPTVLIAVLALSVGTEEALGQAIWRERSAKAFAAEGLAAVRVENSRGRVTVRRGNPGQVHLAALKTVRASDADLRRRYARGTTVVTETSGDRLLIQVRYPQRQSVKVSFWDMVNDYDFPSVEIHLELEVPDGIEVELQSTSGDLVTEEVGGRQSLETTSGDITVHGARATVRAQTTSGDILARALGTSRFETVSGDVQAEAMRGPLRVGTISGSVAVKGIEDSLRVTSVSGDIRVRTAPRGIHARSTSGAITVEEARGAVRLETSSGDIRVGLASPLLRADISTVSGDVVAGLAGTVGMDLEMRTTNGTLDVDVPLEVRSVNRRLVSGVVGSGRAPVTFKSSSGDIHLSSGGTP